MTDSSIKARRTGGLYITKSTLFKVYLLLGVAIVSVLFIWYTFGVIENLQRDTRSQVDKFVKMWQLAANSPNTGSAELQFIFDEIIVKATFPIIVLNQEREPIHWRNIPGVDPTDTTFETKKQLKEIAAEMRREHDEFPLQFAENYVNYFCYGDSKVIEQLKMMPFIEIGIVVSFMLVALIGFQNIKRSEERHIWVGMAKETAHQLGTPISSLLGWLEMIKSEKNSDNSKVRSEEVDEALNNMMVDINRLERIANRFGLIGSKPELEPQDFNQLIQQTIDYYKKRLPLEEQGRTLEFKAGEIPPVAISPELLSWAFENLIKNALQSVDSKSGRVEIRSFLSADGREAVVEVSDNGPGIPSGAARKIFRPGFTTKKRGWGLGLSLVKRIVEESHGGKVFLKRSKPGETVFELNLPLG